MTDPRAVTAAPLAATGKPATRACRSGGATAGEFLP